MIGYILVEMAAIVRNCLSVSMKWSLSLLLSDNSVQNFALVVGERDAIVIVPAAAFVEISFCNKCCCTE